MTASDRYFFLDLDSLGMWGEQEGSTKEEAEKLAEDLFSDRDNAYRVVIVKGRIIRPNVKL